ncbi:hypothetical protein Glove_26g113 [Diversispora epigaea]|uniref:Uncharacterized protein n=1 Tax=Diversispora epigaea TaxID=1348612 RepID=A0A397JUN7_9GLOM|nr:hypothetical protein Glove_26g113 [Diversispora epigaea]
MMPIAELYEICKIALKKVYRAFNKKRKTNKDSEECFNDKDNNNKGDDNDNNNDDGSDNDNDNGGEDKDDEE